MNNIASIALEPFHVPDSILSAHRRCHMWRPGQHRPVFMLCEVDEETIIRMCDEFKANVLRGRASLIAQGAMNSAISSEEPASVKDLTS